jgi:hypothetical protein
MGPFRYVRLKLRWHLFSPTDAPNLRFSSRWKRAKLKPTTRVGCNSGSPNIAPRYAINKIKKISLGRFFKIFLIVYSHIRHAQLGLLWRIRLGCFYKNKKRPEGRLLFLAAHIEKNSNTIIQEIINIAEMLTDADIALYDMHRTCTEQTPQNPDK